MVKAALHNVKVLKVKQLLIKTPRFLSTVRTYVNTRMSAFVRTVIQLWRQIKKNFSFALVEI